MDRIIELRAGQARLRVAPALGGRVLDLRLARPDGRDAVDILAPFPEGTPPDALLHWPKGGIYPLIPYSNRIRDAQLRFEGRVHPLLAHPDAAPHTLHGHAHRTAWRAGAVTVSRATWHLDHRGGGEWPWAFRATLSADLTEHAVAFWMQIENTGRASMPAGMGLHPYFVHDPADVPSFRTRVEWPITPDFLAGSPRPHDGDVESGHPLPPGDFTAYRSGWDGGFTLRHSDGATVEMRADPIFDHLVIHRPAGAPYLCAEPVSHASDGFNMAEDRVSGAGRIVLAPGQACEGTVRIALVDRS